ncbi:MAG: DUF1800 domain-containing protein [Planctomycetota bacterium]
MPRPHRLSTLGLRGAVVPEQIADRDFGYDQARHLLWRAGFGGTPPQIRALAQMGPEAAVDFLLDARDPEPSLPGFIDRNVIRPYTPEERLAYAQARQRRDEDTLARLREQRQQQQRRDRRQMRDTQHWWLARMIQSPAPLQEKMALFWHGHFATSYRTIEDAYHMALQNAMFRELGLGNFGDLLYRIIRDPAMLAYLDQNDSRVDAPNENLAREIMELFALGVGNYGEGDIKAGARALTGYTFRDDEFVFEPDNHDGGNKRILGSVGNFDGDGFVTRILSQRACASFVCRKLYRFFAADLPPDAASGGMDLPRDTREMIRTMETELTMQRYNLRPVLRRLFLSEHFYSDAVVGSQIKSPAVLVAGAIRSLNTPARDVSVLLDAMDRMGQNLFFPPSVKGWDGGRAWINTATLFVRQNALVYLLTGRMPDQQASTETGFDPLPLLADLGDDAAKPNAAIDYLLKLTLGGTPEGPRQELRAFMNRYDLPVNRDSVTGLLLLITAMPEYQLT